MSNHKLNRDKVHRVAKGKPDDRWLRRLELLPKISWGKNGFRRNRQLFGDDDVLINRRGTRAILKRMRSQELVGGNNKQTKRRNKKRRRYPS